MVRVEEIVVGKLEVDKIVDVPEEIWVVVIELPGWVETDVVDWVRFVVVVRSDTDRTVVVTGELDVAVEVLVSVRLSTGRVVREVGKVEVAVGAEVVEVGPTVLVVAVPDPVDVAVPAMVEVIDD